MFLITEFAETMILLASIAMIGAITDAGSIHRSFRNCLNENIVISALTAIFDRKLGYFSVSNVKPLRSLDNFMAVGKTPTRGRGVIFHFSIIFLIFCTF